MPMSKHNATFTISGLLFFTAFVSASIAAWLWVLQSSLWNSTNYLPNLIPPSIPIIPVGLFFAPLMCIVFTIANIVLLARSSPRPVTPLFFLGLIPLAFMVEESANTRYLAILTLVSATTIIEPIFRNVDSKWKIIASFCFAITFGYYLLIVAALITASC